MPSLKDIRRRIQSVQQTQQITRAMRMVAAAKLRRAQDAILAARPYADRMRSTLAEVARGETEARHPLLERRAATRNVEFVVITSDRGLCGAFNANVLKQADVAITDEAAEGVLLTPVGRRAADHYRKRRRDQIVRTVTGIAQVDYALAADIARGVAGRYTAGESDAVILVYAEFVSVMTQRPRCERILPVALEEADGRPRQALPYAIEPDAESLLRVLAPRAVEVEVFRALLENQAGEHAARMTAMESATRNTEELIDSLTLQYNRVRQAAITKELVEIVSGAEAL